LLLPLLVLLLAVLHLAERRPGLGRRAQPPRACGGEEVEAWAGSVEVPSGGRLQVNLAPLHSNSDRQRFEAQSLARRLDLGEGEPWRLVLRHVGHPGADLELGGLVVADEGGARLRPLSPPAQTEGIADPLAVLLAAPERLTAGSARTLVLWGPAPSGTPRLGGLGVSGPELVPLVPGSVAGSELDGSLVRIERFARIQPPRRGD
jgi:hypothetical protein